MLKIDVTNVNTYLRLTSAAADRQEIKEAARYWLLAFNEIRMQRHISKAKLIQAKMEQIAFKIEIDHSFDTYQGSNN